MTFGVVKLCMLADERNNLIQLKHALVQQRDRRFVGPFVRRAVAWGADLVSTLHLLV